jgi:murein DD-endopeptidase MepM/ murein hydrolase activator NlpD
VALAFGIIGFGAAVSRASNDGGLPERAAAKPQPSHFRAKQISAAHTNVLSGARSAETERFTGKVGANLTEALRASGVPDRQGREYVATLRHAIQLDDGLSVQDRFDLIIAREPSGDFGQLLYAGLDRVARADVELLKWTDGKSVIWINADGVGGENSSTMGLPVHGRLTSGFGERFHPILGYVRFHDGVDLATAAGTPITAAADGRVVGAGWHGGYGQQVQIAHANGLETSYGHMSRIAARVGEFVRKGEVIGYVGSTGLSTGPHLHFEVMRNGRPVNPMSVKLSAGPAQLEGSKLHQFQDELRHLLLASES